MSINSIKALATTVTNSNDIENFIDSTNSVLVKPKNSAGISGFVFDIPESESITLESEITDHYTESNEYINDHEIRKPIQITLTGLVGELKFTPDTGLSGSLQAIDNRLETVESYLGDLTPGAVQIVQNAVSKAQTAVSNINQTLDRVQNVADLFSGDSSETTLQEKAYNTFYGYWKSNTLLSVVTPWGYTTNMRIITLTATQNADTDQITSFSVTLKQLRFAKTKTTSFKNDITAARVNMQDAEAEEVGKVQGREESFLFSVSEAL